jgi:hypothetical protein
MSSKRMDDTGVLTGLLSETPESKPCERCKRPIRAIDTGMGWFNPPVCDACVEGERAAVRSAERAARIKAWTRELERQQGGALHTQLRVELPDLLASFVTAGGGWLPGQSALYLCGSTGGGKTQSMTEMAQRVIEQSADEALPNCPVAYASMQDVMHRLRERQDISHLVTARWLFLDEIASVALTDWGHEQVLAIINKRCQSLKPTIYASNYHIADLIEWGGSADAHGASYGVAGWDHRIMTRLMAAIGGLDADHRLPGVVTFARNWRMEVRR